MTSITVSQTINATFDMVFSTVSDIRNFSKAIPNIVRYEFLSEKKCGVGTRFRETRMMNGKDATTELEVTEFVENDSIRMVADSHGTVWDSLFTVKSDEGQVVLTLTMDAIPHKFLPRIMNPLIKGMLKKALEKDLALVKVYCEK